MPALKEVFNQEYIGKLNNIKFNMSKSHTGSFSGNRRSKSKGSSLEFSDFRNYTLGDDIRRIDWNSYGRLDKLFVKVFEEERQSNINIFLDISESMDFGEKNKLFFSKVIAVSLAYIGLSQGDSVNIFTLNDNLKLEIGNASSRNMINKSIDFLASLSAKGETNINKAFENISKYRLRPGLSVVISDFLTSDYQKAISSLLSKKQKLCAIHVLAKEEMNPEISGGIRLLDQENKGTMDIEIDDYVIGEYKKELNNHIKKIEVFCKSKSVNYILSQSDESYYQVCSQV